MSNMMNSNLLPASNAENCLQKTTESWAKDSTSQSKESAKDTTTPFGNLPQVVHLYTDGSSSKQGTWGWAWVAVDPVTQDYFTYGSGAGSNGTCNVAELTAAWEGLKTLKHLEVDCNIVVHSDSAYLVNCFKDNWHAKWEANGWKAGRSKVKNAELWRELIGQVSQMSVTFVHVPGHAGVYWNEWCDQAAKAARYDLEAEIGA